MLSYLQAHFFQHQRLCACRQMWPDAVAGGVDKLVGLLDNPAGKTRAAAALALYRMSLASPEFCSNVFTSLCNAMLHRRAEAAVLAALEPLYTGDPSEQLAATYLLHVRSSLSAPT